MAATFYFSACGRSLSLAGQAPIDWGVAGRVGCLWEQGNPVISDFVALIFSASAGFRSREFSTSNLHRQSASE